MTQFINESVKLFTLLNVPSIWDTTASPLQDFSIFGSITEVSEDGLHPHIHFQEECY